MRTRGISPLASWLDGVLENRLSDHSRTQVYKTLTFILTFMAYMLYHANRKVVSVVKTVWNQNCTEVFPNDTSHNSTTWCDWAPFDGPHSSELIGSMDTAFLASYALTMFLCGYVAERSNLRIFLGAGMFLSGLFNLLVGAGYWFGIHSYAYYMAMNVLAGASQSSGWPAVVPFMGRWFGQAKRGGIMGVWNCHTSLGNIVGSLVAGAFVQTDWGLSFGVLAMVMMAGGVLVWLMAVPHPACVGLPDPNDTREEGAPSALPRYSRSSVSSSQSAHSVFDSDDDEVVSPVFEDVQRRRPQAETSDGSRSPSPRNYGAVTSDLDTSPLLEQGSEQLSGDGDGTKAIGFFAAFLIPGVLTYSIALFFVKFVNYIFMYWLPIFINNSTDFSPSESASVSVAFDVGGIIGGVAAGVLHDKTGKPANVCFWSMVASIPMLYLYYQFGAQSLTLNYTLLFITGLFNNAPYALIATAVTADLGTQDCLKGNSHALATVTALIDGTGSIGAALGPLMTGFVQEHFGWAAVFNMLMTASGIAVLCLLRLTVKEMCGSARPSHAPI